MVSKKQKYTYMRTVQLKHIDRDFIMSNDP